MITTPIIALFLIFTLLIVLLWLAEDKKDRWIVSVMLTLTAGVWIAGWLLP